MKRTITYSFIFIVLCLVALWIAYADIVAATFLEDDKLQYSAEADREIAQCDAHEFSWNTKGGFCDEPNFFKSVDLTEFAYSPTKSQLAPSSLSINEHTVDSDAALMALKSDGVDIRKLKHCKEALGYKDHEMHALGWCIRYFYEDKPAIIKTYRERLSLWLILQKNRGL